MTTEKGKREKWLDVVKGVGILLMVVGHTKVSDAIKIWIYSFHMPLFFMVTGYLFSKEKWENRGLKFLLKSRAHAYLIPYAVLFFINLIIYSGIEKISGGAQHKLLFNCRIVFP